MSATMPIATKDLSLIDAFGSALEGIALLNREFDRSLKAEAGIPLTWFEALLRLHREGEPVPVGLLGEQLVLTSGGATRLVDRLADEGYVERLACPTDRRIQHIALTDAGTAVFERALEVHIADLERLFGAATTPADRDDLIRIFGALRSCS
jgi:DNA-binding MarR family transcriptional regulator